MSNQVYISQDANEVNLVNTDKQIVITEVGDGTTVNVTQPITSVITVASVGPQGQPGPTGPQGPSGSLSINSSGSFRITGSLFISGSAPLVVTGPTVMSGSLNVTEGITGSLFGTASYTLTASYTTNISGGSTGYIPLWKSNSTLGTSSLHQDDGNVGVGILLPEAKLHVKGQGSTDLYSSFIVQNSNGNPSFVILGSGHVGIENLAPAYEFDVTGTGRFTNGLLITGSVSISSILTLTPQTPLPSGVRTGSFAVSSSTPPKPYFYDGTSWNALY